MICVSLNSTTFIFADNSASSVYSDSFSPSAFIIRVYSHNKIFLVDCEIVYCHSEVHKSPSDIIFPFLSIILNETFLVSETKIVASIFSHSFKIDLAGDITVILAGDLCTSVVLSSPGVFSVSFFHHQPQPLQAVKVQAVSIVATLIQK
ncbi:MAG: hypothetical protein P1U46_03580 [Patescibacteria group bacterium]|nr:hypothetical protein [Patescibacteria group bacterium]